MNEQKLEQELKKPFTDSIKENAKSPIFLTGAAFYFVFSVISATALLFERLNIIKETELLLDTIMWFDTETAMVYSGEILWHNFYIAACAIMLIPMLFFTLGFLFNISAPEKNNTPGASFIRAGALVSIISVLFSAFINIREITASTDESLETKQVFNIIFILAAVVLSIWVFIKVIEIAKNIAHVLSTGDFYDFFSARTAIIIFVISMLDLRVFLFSFNTVGGVEFAGILGTAGGVIMAYSYLKFCSDYEQVFNSFRLMQFQAAKKAAD
jgi:succinate dehydrogenase hydrophobic anchor subunit